MTGYVNIGGLILNFRQLLKFYTCFCYSYYYFDTFLGPLFDNLDIFVNFKNIILYFIIIKKRGICYILCK
jgi:hypothetical protein